MTTDTRHPDISPEFWTKPVAYPELRPRSILEPLPLGIRPTGGTADAGIRHSSTYVWGLHGSGRTTTLRDITAGLLQCTDALVWTIGTDIALPLLRQYGAGVAETPCIDWVAPTLDEACTMALTGLHIALDRKRAYAELKYHHNTSTMPVGDGTEHGPAGSPPPAIVIVVGPDAPRRRDSENKHLYDLLRMIDDMGRDSAVRVVYSGFRPTTDYAPSPLPEIRIGMRPTDPNDLMHGFGTWDLEPLPHIGGGYLRTGDYTDPEPFKAFYLSQVRLSVIGEQTAPWRPKLDQNSWMVDVDAYMFRWRRTAGALWVNPPASTLDYQGVS